MTSCPCGAEIKTEHYAMIEKFWNVHNIAHVERVLELMKPAPVINNVTQTCRRFDLSPDKTAAMGEERAAAAAANAVTV